MVINNGILKENKPLLANIRKVVQAARHPFVKAYLNSRGYSQPKLDVITRLGSSYLMVKSINSIQDVVQELSENEPDLHRTRYQWTCAKELEGLLKGPYEVTLAFSSDSLTAGLFVYLWNRLKYQLNYGSDGMGTNMSEFMDQREGSLFNAVTLAAVSIDPKYSYVLELEQEVIAVQAITKLLMRLEKPVGDDESIGNDSQDEDAILVRDITEPETEENGYNRLLLLHRASGDVGSKNVEDEVILCTTKNTSHHHCHLSLLSRA